MTNTAILEAMSRQLETPEIESIKAGAEKLFLYVGKKPLTGDPAKYFGVGHDFYCVQTWLGTFLGWAWVGRRVYTGFGYRTYRRAVTVRMFGVLYNGW